MASPATYTFNYATSLATVKEGTVVLSGQSVTAYDSTSNLSLGTVSTNTTGIATFFLRPSISVYYKTTYKGVTLQSPTVTVPAGATITFPVASTITVSYFNNAPVVYQSVKVFEGTTQLTTINTDAQGKASVPIESGKSIYFQATYLGMTYKSPVITTPGNTIIRSPKTSTVTVSFFDNTPVANYTVKVYEGTNLVTTINTDAQGKASVGLDGGKSIYFQATYLNMTYKSAVVTSPADITIKSPAPSTVTVLNSGGTPAGYVIVKAFEGTTELSNFWTDAQGKGTVGIDPGKSIYFQTTYNGTALKSPTVTTPGNATIQYP